MNQYGYVIAAYCAAAALYGGYLLALLLRERALRQRVTTVHKGQELIRDGRLR